MYMPYIWGVGGVTGIKNVVQRFKGNVGLNSSSAPLNINVHVKMSSQREPSLPTVWGLNSQQLKICTDTSWGLLKRGGVLHVYFQSALVGRKDFEFFYFWRNHSIFIQHFCAKLAHLVLVMVFPYSHGPVSLWNQVDLVKMFVLWGFGRKLGVIWIPKHGDKTYTEIMLIMSNNHFLPTNLPAENMKLTRVFISSSSVYISAE